MHLRPVLPIGSCRLLYVVNSSRHWQDGTVLRRDGDEIPVTYVPLAVLRQPLAS